jgi:hypothetical protein
MPTGIVESNNGPQEQETIGQIKCSNGDIISFFNTKGLSKGEPVIFDIVRTKLRVKGVLDDVKFDFWAKTPVGILPFDFEVGGEKSKKKWPAKLQERWKKEWAEFKDDDEIRAIFGGPVKTSVKNHPHCDNPGIKQGYSAS